MSLDGPDRCIYISTLLSEEEKAKLRQVIQLNADVFAWSHADMTGISPSHASHRLNVAPPAKPVRQKVRHFRPDSHSVIQAEIDNLLQNGFIRAVKYPNGWPMWLWFQRRGTNGEYVWITRTSMMPVQKIASPCHA